MNKKIGNDGEWVTMIDSIQEITIKSDGISEPGRESVTGSSWEVSQQVLIVTGVECAGPEDNSELEWAKRHMKEGEEKKEETAPQLIERKTELHCADPAPVRKRKGAVQHWGEQDTKIPDPEVLYRNLETVVRELSSSPREWQEGMGGQILTRLNELDCRADDIEYERDHQSPFGKSLQQWEDSK